MMEEDGGGGQDKGNEYDSVIQGMKAQDAARTPLRQSFSAAQEIGQADAIKALELSRKTGIAPENILKNLDYVGRRAATPTDQQYDDLVTNAPKLGGWARDPLNAAAIQGDVENFKNIERLMSEAHLAPLKARPDEELLKQAQETGKERGAARFKTQEENQGDTYVDTGGGEIVKAIPPPKRTLEEWQRDSIDEEYARLKKLEGFVSGEGRVNPLEYLTTEYGLKGQAPGIPFLASAQKLGNGINLISAANRYDAGNPTKDDIQALQEFARLQLAEEHRGTMFSTKLLETGLGITEFGGEMWATGGLSAAGKKLVLGGVEEASVGLLKRTLAKVAGTLVQLPAAGITAIPAGVAQRMQQQGQLSVDENGQIQYSQTAGQSAPIAIKNAVLGRFADQFSAELFGLFSAKVPNATEAMMKQRIAKEGVKEVFKFIGMNEVSQLIKEVSTAEPWRAPTTIKAMMGDRGAIEDILAQAAGGFAMGAGGAFVHNKLADHAQAKAKLSMTTHYNELLKKAGESVAETAVFKKSPQVAESALAAQFEGGPDEFQNVNAHVFSEKLLQAGVDPNAFAADLTGKPKALQDAMDLGPGGELKVPTSAVIARIMADPKMSALFQGEFREDPRLPSINVGQEHLAKLDAEMEAERKAAAEKKTASPKQGLLYDAEVKAEAEAPSGGQPVVPANTPEARQHAQTLWDGYANGTVLEHGDGRRWLVQKNKKGGGSITLLNENGQQAGGASYDINVDSKSALNIIARTKEVKSKGATAGDVKDFASIQGKDIAIQAEQAGRPKHEANLIGKIVEAVYRTLGIRGSTPAEEMGQAHGPIIQKGEQPTQGERGSYVPPDITKSQSLIEAFKSADPSTIPHELAHHFLDILAGDPKLADMFGKFLKDRGIESPEAWAKMSLEEKRPHHETFAKSYEDYLYHGEAPSKELRSVFHRYRELLNDTYQKTGKTAQPISPEIRDIFERLHATDEEIKAAKERLGKLEPHLAKVKSIVLDAASADKLAELVSEANRAATERLDKEALDEINHQRSDEYKKIREEVTAATTKQVDSAPDYRAKSIIETGLEPDGTPVDYALGGFKFDRAMVAEKYGEETAKALPKEMVSSEGGNDPDTMAEVLGYTSGDELIKKMSNLEGRDSLIERLTNDTMSKMRLDPLETLPEKAREAIHNDAEQKLNLYQADWVAKNRLPQLKELYSYLSNPRKYIKEIRDFAEGKMKGESYRRADPRTYETGEREAHRLATEALNGGNYKGFIAYVEKEMLNAELYRASIAARENAESIQAKMRKTRTKDFRSAIFTANPEHLAQIDAINDQYSFSNEGVTSIERKKNLRDFVEGLTDDNYIVQIPDNVLNAAYKENWKDVPMGHLAEIEETVDRISKNAKLKNELLGRKEKRDLNAAVTSIVAEVRENGGKVLPKPIDSYSREAELKRKGSKAAQELVKDSTLLRIMAGGKDGGALWEFIQRPIDESGTNEAVRNEKTGREWNRIFDLFTKKESLHLYDKVYIPEVNGSLSRMNIMMTGLLYAQEGAAQRFADGREWGDKEIKAILAHLTPKEVQWINEMHKLTNANKGEAKAQMERATGLPAKMVEGVPVDAPAGRIEGGYAKFMYDSRGDLQSAKLAEKDAKKSVYNGASLQASTKAGYREERAQGVKRTLRIDFGVLSQALKEMNHDLSHYETLLDVNRLLRHPEMEKAIKEHYGNITYEHLEGWLNDIATGDKPAQSPFEQGLGWLRQGTSTSALAWSFMQAITDPVGITQGAKRIGYKWLAKGIGRWLGDAAKMENTVKWIDENSDFMRLRSRTWERGVNEVRNQVTGKSKAEMYLDYGLDSISHGHLDIDDIHNSFYWMMAKAQMVQDVPTFLGAYEKSMADLPKDATPAEREAHHKKSIALAERAVLDAFGGGQIKDLAPIQKGSEAKKLFTAFYSFASTTLNHAIESSVELKRGFKNAPIKSVGKFANDMALLYILPPLLTLSIKRLVTGNDDEDFKKRLMQEELSYAIGSVPGLKEFASAASGNDYSGPAPTRLFGSIGKGARRAFEGKMDWHDFNQAGGILFHYPSMAIQRLIDGTVALDEGRSQNSAAPLFGVHRKH